MYEEKDELYIIYKKYVQQQNGKEQKKLKREPKRAI